MFYFADLIISNSYDAKTNKYGWDPSQVFVALFAIFFGASHAGTSGSMGPDVGKAHGAAKRIFSIIE